MNYIFKYVGQRANRMSRCVILAAGLLVAFTAPSDADNLKPKLVAANQGILRYETPAGSGRISEDKLNWEWMDSQSNLQCKEAGLGLRTEEIMIISHNDGRLWVLYFCEKHNAELVANLKEQLKEHLGVSK